jgi:hypothetical protein
LTFKWALDFFFKEKQNTRCPILVLDDALTPIQNATKYNNRTKVRVGIEEKEQA